MVRKRRAHGRGVEKPSEEKGGVMSGEIVVFETEESRRIDARRKRRIAEAEKAQGVTIDFTGDLTAGTNENGEYTLRDQHGNTLILPPLSPEEQAEDERDHALFHAKASRARENT